jgi:hypothetical protein
MPVAVRALMVVVLLATSACETLAPVPGPPPLALDQITEVRVAELSEESGERSPRQRSFRDPDKIREIAKLYALSSAGWHGGCCFESLPLYRVDVIGGPGSQVTYWVGTYSHPARPPCFWFCTGWWIAPSDAAGAIDPSIRKELGAEGQYLPFVFALEIPFTTSHPGD